MGHKNFYVYPHTLIITEAHHCFYWLHRNVSLPWLR